MTAVNIIEYITIASAGNATDFGNLTATSYSQASACSIVRGLFFSGAGRDAIDYITIASTGNATDFGDHLANDGTRQGFVVHNKIYAYYSRTAGNNIQEKHTIATAANATSFTWTKLGSTFNQSTLAKTVMKGWIAASG